MVAALLLGLMLAALALGGLQGVMAAPPPAPTPVASVYSGGEPLNVSLWDTEAITQATNGGGRQLPGYESLDIQYVVDISDTQGVTLTVQYSNDNVNWVSGPTLVTNTTSDGTDLQQIHNLGRYTRVAADLSSTNTVTLTVLAVAK